MDVDEQPTDERAGSSRTAIVCLRVGDEPEDWYLEQVHALGAVEWGAPDPLDDEAWVQQAASAVADRSDGGSVHLIAVGAAVPRALLLAARRPELVTSVLAGDPEVDENDPAYWELLRKVRAPTLVLVAAPQSDSDTSQAQTVAGGIDNGVMVIVDGCTAPMHRQAPHSFNEWVTSFMSIAEGLRALDPHTREQTHA